MVYSDPTLIFPTVAVAASLRPGGHTLFPVALKMDGDPEAVAVDLLVDMVGEEAEVDVPLCLGLEEEAGLGYTAVADYP